MFTYAIRKPIAQLPSRYEGPHQPANNWTFGQPYRPPAPVQNRGGLYGATMAKEDYAKWVEGPNVKGRFYPGMLCTIASAVYQPGKAPVTTFLVDHIQEIHYLAPLDLDAKEPRCIGVKPHNSSVTVLYPPCKLRPLNVEETKLVDLRNSQTAATVRPKTEQLKSSGTRREVRTAILGGEVVLVDSVTGELVLTEDGRNEDPNECYCG